MSKHLQKYERRQLELAKVNQQYDVGLFRFISRRTAGNLRLAKSLCAYVKRYYVSKKEFEKEYKEAKFFCEGCKKARTKENRIQKALRTQTDFLIGL